MSLQNEPDKPISMFDMKIRWLIAFAFCGLTLSFLAPALRKWSAPGFSPASLARNTAPVTKPLPAYIRSLRPNYPYSVIPGGAYSPQELRYASGKDNVVRAHYADFHLDDARVVKLTAPRYEYVSYRIQNRVYWTGKKLRIPEGEYLLTDGVHFARTRCGNRLSDQPSGEISSLEPPPALLSQPLLRPDLLSNLDLPQTPPLAMMPQTPADSSPRLAPVLPSDSGASVSLAQAPVFMAAAPSVPVGLPPAFLGTPGGGLPGSPSAPPSGAPPSQPPINTTPDAPAIPSPVPEPASIYLFLITLVVTLWALTRVLTAEEKPDAE
jgi:hypothetical protein